MFISDGTHQTPVMPITRLSALRSTTQKPKPCFRRHAPVDAIDEGVALDTRQPAQPKAPGRR